MAASLVVTKPPLAGGDDFVHLQAEPAHVAPRADGLILVSRPGRLGAVFYHTQVVPSRDVHDGVHLGGHAARMHRHDGAGAGRDAILDVVRSERERLVDVGKHRDGLMGGHGARRGDEGERGNNHLIAGRNVEGFQADFESGGAGSDTQRVRRAHHAGRLALQCRNFVRLIHAVEAEGRAAVQYLQNEFSFLISNEARAGITGLQRGSADRRAAIHGQAFDFCRHDLVLLSVGYK